MPKKSWKTSMTELQAAQAAFIDGDAGPLQALFSHAGDVTVMGGFGGVERGWPGRPRISTVVLTASRSSV